jgi:hypothetical protein
MKREGAKRVENVKKREGIKRKEQKEINGIPSDSPLRTDGKECILAI